MWMLLIVLIVVSHPCLSAVPGLPFVEDFTDTALRGTATTADWSTVEQALILAGERPLRRRTVERVQSPEVPVPDFDRRANGRVLSGHPTEP
jgi:hypothetical protein